VWFGTGFFEIDVFVIGGGAAGSMAAIRSSEFNFSVTVLEKAVLRSCGDIPYLGFFSSVYSPKKPFAL